MRHPRTGAGLEARAVWAHHRASRQESEDEEDEFAFVAEGSATRAATALADEGARPVTTSQAGAQAEAAAAKVAGYLAVLESQWEALRDEGNALLRGAPAPEEAGATLDAAGSRSRRRSTASGGWAAKAVAVAQRAWLFASRGAPRHAGFAPANNMLLHASSGFLSSVW